MQSIIDTGITNYRIHSFAPNYIINPNKNIYETPIFFIDRDCHHQFLQQ
mgnify:CR=1 FL=1